MKTKIMDMFSSLQDGETGKFTALVIDVLASAENGQIKLSIHFLTENECFNVASFIAKNAQNVEQIKTKYVGKVACVTVEKAGGLRAIHLALATNADATPFIPELSSIKKMESKSRAVIGALITAVEEKKARNGAVYSSISLSDAESSRSMTCFTTSKTEDILAYQQYVGKVAVILVSCDDKEKGYYRVEKIFTPVDVNRQKYITSAPIPAEEMYEGIVKELRRFCDENQFSIAKVALAIYEKNREQLIWASAAKKMHHNTVGGLLYHIYRMLRLAKRYCEVYPLDAELLEVGVVLHDIGKLREMKTDSLGETTYTVEGTLFGHSLLGCDMVKEEFLNFPKNYQERNKEKMRMVIHMIASHHGSSEQGAIKPPATGEARALHDIDVFDSRYYLYEKESATLEEGKMSDRIWGLDGVCVYRSITDPLQNN